MSRSACATCSARARKCRRPRTSIARAVASSSFREKGERCMRASAIVISALLLAVAPAWAQRPNQGEDESAELVAEGRGALRDGDYDGAAKALDQAIALNPRRMEAYALRAAVHSAKGENARGVALMRKARDLAPDNVDVLAALGTQLVLAGELDEGVPLLEQVVAKAPAQY